MISSFSLARHAMALSAAGVLFGAVAFSSTASADPPAPPPLPEEAFTACASKADGAACSVTFHDHTMSGTCAKHPSDARLFCRLNGPPPPPPEALTACEGKKSSDECTMQFAGHSMSGNCVDAPEGKLVCAPARPPSQEPQR